MGIANDTVDRIAANMLAPQGAGNMPIMLCRRIFPHPRTYLMFDGGWEGLKKVSRGGVISWEIDLDFQLRIEIDGLCSIPDTKNNREKLDRVSKPQARMMDYDPITGIKHEEPKQFISLPEYVRVDKTVLERGMADQIAELVMKKMAEAGQTLPDLKIAEGRDNRPGSAQYTQTVEIAEAPKKVKKGQDPLLDPLAR